MRKRIWTSIFLILFLALIGGLFHNALKPESLSPGGVLPEIVFRSEVGFSERLRVDSTRMTLVVYFHSDCEPCLSQLQLFNETPSVLENTRIFLLTDEKDFFAHKRMYTWPNLMNASNFTWGIAEAEQLVEGLGARVTPSIYIFDGNGTLLKKIVGEIKLDGLLSELRKYDNPNAI